MQQKPSIGASRPSGVSAMPTPLLVAAILTSAAVAIGTAVLYGGAARASLELAWAVEIDRESSEICAALGKISASDRSTCAEALAQVRRLHEERLSRQPIL